MAKSYGFVDAYTFESTYTKSLSGVWTVKEREEVVAQPPEQAKRVLVAPVAVFSAGYYRTEALAGYVLGNTAYVAKDKYLRLF